jgi:thiamine-phosphate pyrophosphorylase
MKTLPDPVLMLVTEPSPGLPETVCAAVRGGVNMVQLRDPSAGREQLLRRAGQLREMIELPALLIINRHVEEAVSCQADGVQLPEAHPSIREVRSTLGEDRWIGCSIHSVEKACQAEAEGADYLIAGTIFPSATHPDIPAQGLEFLERVCRAVRIPVIAIGGITPENAPDCLHVGACGVAVLSAIMRSADPEQAARAFRRSLEEGSGDDKTQDKRRRAHH